MQTPLTTIFNAIRKGWFILKGFSRAQRGRHRGVICMLLFITTVTCVLGVFTGLQMIVAYRQQDILGDRSDNTGANRVKQMEWAAIHIGMPFLYMDGIVGEWSIGPGKVGDLVVGWNLKVQCAQVPACDIPTTPSQFSVFMNLPPQSWSYSDPYPFNASSATWNVTVDEYAYHNGYIYDSSDWGYVSNLTLPASPLVYYHLNGFTASTPKSIWGMTTSTDLARATDAIYPFDEYYIRPVLLTVFDTNTGEYVPVFDVKLMNVYHGQWAFEAGTTVFVDKNYTLVTIKVKRNLIIIISAMILVVASWVATIAVLYATLAYSYGGWRVIPGTDSVILPFTGLFALPTVRGVMPGNPPFGSFIDFFGIIPNLVILAFCAFIHVVVRLNQESKPPRPQHPKDPDNVELDELIQRPQHPRIESDSTVV